MDGVMGDRIVRVLIADDQPQVCSALRLMLRQDPGTMVVAEASDADQAILLAATQQPDLVLLDWELRGQRDGSKLAELRAARPGLKVIALSGRPEARSAALAAGADMFVSKGDPPEQLLRAVDGCKRFLSGTEFNSWDRMVLKPNLLG
jgi:DNA-binding NarL/FixJ family response regulator